jgi:hypothetical protein
LVEVREREKWVLPLLHIQADLQRVERQAAHDIASQRLLGSDRFDGTLRE